MASCPPCKLDYSTGNGSGVAEAIGNWGFSNEVVSPGHELSRMQCLLERIEKLKGSPQCSPQPPKRNCPTQVQVCCRSPPESRPVWMFPEKCPLITFCSVGVTLKTSDRKLARADAQMPILGRRFAVQGNDKWYKLGPLCCPQPSCPAPCCPRIEKFYCSTGRC